MNPANDDAQEWAVAAVANNGEMDVCLSSSEEGPVLWCLEIANASTSLRLSVAGPTILKQLLEFARAALAQASFEEMRISDAFLGQAVTLASDGEWAGRIFLRFHGLRAESVRVTFTPSQTQSLVVCLREMLSQISMQ